MAADRSTTSRGIGASANLIVSQQWSALTVHVNTQVALTRAGNLDLFEGVIVEGPQWTVRPVAEVFVEREFGAPSSSPVSPARSGRSATSLRSMPPCVSRVSTAQACSRRVQD